MSITLTPELEQFLQAQVAAGRYPSIDVAVCDAVRDLRDRDAARDSLRQKIAVAEARISSGEGIDLEDDDAIDAFFEEILSQGT